MARKMNPSPVYRVGIVILGFFNFSSSAQNDSTITVFGEDTVHMMINCRPPTLMMTEFDTVTVKVDPNDVNKFEQNTFLVRAFTNFPNENDNRVIALFHLDDKSLSNSAQGGAPTGSGSPEFSSNGAFRGAISSGAFTTSLLMPINLDFTVECWIKPSSAIQTADIINGPNFSFGLANGYLTATICTTTKTTGAITVTTTNTVDKNAWQHVAIARVKGKANLYINGIPMAVEVNTNGFIGVPLIIGNFTGGLLDEVRISQFVKTMVLQGKTLLEIPTAQNIRWKIDERISESPTTILTPEMWNSTVKGNLQFLFADLLPGSVIINFFDTLTSPPKMWSKNGGPVLFRTTPLIVSATLKDTSHDGHLDMIDLTWTDNILLKAYLPNVNAFIQTLIITTMDGKADTLHAVTLIPDQAKKTIHIILNQNTGKTLETEWKEPTKIFLADVPMTIDGKPFVVGLVIDSAAPIPTFACCCPAKNEDTVKITFSEDIMTDSIALAMLIRARGEIKNSLASFNPISKKKNNLMVIVIPVVSGQEHTMRVPSDQIQEVFITEASSPSVPLDSCHAYPHAVISSTDEIHPGVLITTQNGFNPKINIRFPLPKTERFSVRIYNLHGQLESMPFNEIQAAGNYSLEIPSRLLATGSYLVVFKAEELHKEKLIFVIK
jgi:hypothetical protein